MGIGPKIKEYRKKYNITQKDLADELHVTYQAVSKWENDEAEPSFDTVKEMCRIFNCSADDLFSMEKKEEPQANASVQPEVEESSASEPEAKEEAPAPIEPQVVEKIVYKEPEKVLALCHDCNKALYHENEIIHTTEIQSYRQGRHHHSKTIPLTLCKECQVKRAEAEKKAKEAEEAAKRAKFRKRRIHSYVWPAIIAALFIALAIVFFVKKENPYAYASLILAVLGAAFCAVMILDNTFVPDLWLDIAELGFVKFPGIIFSFDADGLKFLFIMKILFGLLGILFMVAALAAATAIAMFFSVFAYPFALAKNIKCKE